MQRWNTVRVNRVTAFTVLSRPQTASRIAMNCYPRRRTSQKAKIEMGTLTALIRKSMRSCRSSSTYCIQLYLNATQNSVVPTTNYDPDVLVRLFQSRYSRVLCVRVRVRDVTQANYVLVPGMILLPYTIGPTFVMLYMEVSNHHTGVRTRLMRS